MQFNIPLETLDKALELPGSAALRVFVVVCTAAQDGLATISARELSSRARLSARSVFEALAQLEQQNCIVREDRAPGPNASGIRVVDENVTSDTPSTEDNAPEITPVTDELCDSYVHHGVEDVMSCVSSCFRPLDAVELTETRYFVATTFGDDTVAFMRAVKDLQSRGGVAPDCPVQLFLGAVQSSSKRLT